MTDSVESVLQKLDAECRKRISRHGEMAKVDDLLRSALEPMLAEHSKKLEELVSGMLRLGLTVTDGEQEMTWRNMRAEAAEQALRDEVRKKADVQAENEKLRELLREATQLLKRVSRAYDGSPHLRASIAYFFWSSQQALFPGSAGVRPGSDSVENRAESSNRPQERGISAEQENEK